MRHIGSLLLSLLFTPLIYAMLMRGAYQCETSMTERATGQGDGWQTPMLTGSALLVGASVLCAVLLLTRMSPAGPAVAGLLLAGVGAFTLLNLTWVADKTDLGPVTLHASEAGNIATLVIPLGAMLVMTALSPRRWRGKVAARREPPAPSSMPPATASLPASPSLPPAPPSFPPVSPLFPPAPPAQTLGQAAGMFDEPATTASLPVPIVPPSGPWGSSFNGFQPVHGTHRPPEPYRPAHEDPDTSQSI